MDLSLPTLTAKEASFIREFLRDNGCGAGTPNDLISDNFSCNCVEDLCDSQNLNAQEVGGLISALDKKCILWVEERDRDCDLYWVADWWLEALATDGQGDRNWEELEFGGKK